MQTIQQITDDLKAQASTMGIEGIAVDSLCSLLAYSIYKNQMLQARLNIESSFSTSIDLNSRIHHACELLYSVHRGKCPYIQVTNVIATETKSVKYLDLAFTYNGYYFYYKNDYVFSKSQPISSLEYYCSSKKKQTCEVTNLKNEQFYIDFADENMSEDIKIWSYDTEFGEGEEVTYTNDANLFYTRAEDGKSYKYNYLATTLPGYGVRLMRHSDSSNWGGAVKMAIEYLPYSETLPDFSGFKSIPSVRFTYQPSSTGELGQYELQSKIYTKAYSQRLESIEEIYSRATTASHAKGTVATIEDLIIQLNSIDPQAYFKVYSDLKYNEDESTLTSDPLYTLAIVSNTTVDPVRFTNQLKSWKKAVDVSKEIQVALALPSNTVTLYAKASSSTNVLTNEILANLANSYKSMIGEELHHSKIEADIVRLGFDNVILYNQDKSSEYVGTLNNTGDLQRISYPSVQLYVY